MNKTVQRSTRHDVDEERRDLVKAVENQRVSPHNNRHRIISKCQAKCRREESLGAWKRPYAEHKEHVDEIT